LSGDQLPHPIGTDVPEEHVGGGVVALQDHRLQRGARGDGAGEVRRIEDRGAEREHALVERQRLLHPLFQLHGERGGRRGIEALCGLPQVLGQDEDLEGAGDDELAIRLAAGRP
jgi:hypothetical protein